MKSRIYIILAPHADDELIGAYNFFVAPHSHTILVSGGDVARSQKFRKLCMEFKKKFTIVPHLMSDVLLSYDRELVYDAIYSSIKEAVIPNLPNYVVVPSAFDTHPEHVLVNALGTRAALVLDLGLISYSGRAKSETHMAINEYKLDTIEEYYPEEFKMLGATRYGLDNKSHFTILRKV